MCVLDLIDSQVKAQADAPAVLDRNRELTYRQLDSQSKQIAASLLSAGVVPEGKVVLCMPRSVGFVTAALGILRAGSAYVPLDPDNPPARLTMLLEDSCASVVLTDEATCAKLPDGNWRTIVVDSFASEPAAMEPHTPPDLCGDSLAYVIFTSGSTGRPKGVEITHENLRNLVQWHIKAFGVTTRDRATLLASSGFDAAVWELWPYLAAGASLHVADEDVRSSPEKLQRWLLANEITISFVPTTIAESMNELAWPNDAPLRVLLTGADTLRRFPRPGLPFTLVNNYGPTECTVVTTSGVVSAHPEAGVDTPSIGRPIDDVTVMIVDDQLRPVAEGDAGELLIGGAGVGRGYLNQPELTRERFITLPCATGSGMRFYRTGDRARRLPNGEIAFLGRVDDQIKIRGYRIELGEIVSALSLHPQIRSCCVKPSGDGSQEKQLVGYVVPQAGSQLQANDLRAFLLERLPEYMIPAVFVVVDALPVSASGKVDRAQLPEPKPDNVLSAPSFELPQSEMEQWLTGFLTTLVGTSQIGRDDNFFQLGGHSLMGAQVIAKVQQTFGVELSLRSLFEHPTIREISAAIEKLLDDKLAAMSEEEARQLLET